MRLTIFCLWIFIHFLISIEIWVAIIRYIVITIILVDVQKLSIFVIINNDVDIVWMGIPLSILPSETIVMIWRIVVILYNVISWIIIFPAILVVVLTIFVVVRVYIHSLKVIFLPLWKPKMGWFIGNLRCILLLLANLRCDKLANQ